MAPKVLICDDDDGVLEISAIILREKGYDVVAISDSSNVLAEIKQKQPNILLVDLWMPNLRGEEVVRLIRQDEEIRSIPIIILSAQGKLEKICQEIGADDYLCKPFDIQELEMKVGKFLPL